MKRELLHSGLFLLSILSFACADSLLGNGASNPASPYQRTERPPTYAYKLHDTIIIDISIQDTLKFTKKLETDRQVDNKTTFKKLTAYFGKGPTELPGIDYSKESQYGAESKKEEGQKVSLKIPAEVVDLLPNGDLVLDATRVVHISKDSANVSMGGRVNPKYIFNDMVGSDKILGLYVRTEANGPMADNEHRGFLQRFFDKFKLF
ncbi:MAG: flagellar basal body L-ring protein FlgH [Planctomycetes bacterium]|nr:flagellar basal body L-ring protein FlgH [Planctomycetota bacterium]